MHWDVRNRGDKVRVLAALCYSVCISSFPALRTIVFVGTCVRVHTRMCVCVCAYTYMYVLMLTETRFCYQVSTSVAFNFIF